MEARRPGSQLPVAREYGRGFLCPFQAFFDVGEQVAFFGYREIRQAFGVGLQHGFHFFLGAVALDAGDGFPGDIGICAAGHAVGKFKVVQSVQVVDGGLHGGDACVVGG